MNFKLFIGLLALVGVALAVPARSPYSVHNRDHSEHLESVSDNLHNENGKTYTYSYTARSEIELSNGERSQVIIKSNVDVTTIGSGSEHLMHMRDVRVQGPNEAEQLAARLERSPIWFQQDGGRIRKIAHSAEEDHQTLNLKRAVLSALQVSSYDNAKLTENDIFGQATTEYEQVHHSGSEVQLIKQKKLESSSQRRHPLASLLLKATGQKQQDEKLICKLTVDVNERVIKKLQCSERAQVVPLIGSSSLATQISNEITLQHQETRSQKHQTPSNLNEYTRDTLAFSKPTDLYKQYAKPEQQQQLQRQAERLLQQIREQKAKSESIEKVNELSQAIARMNSRTLQAVADNQLQKQTNSAADKRVHQLFVDLVAQSGNQEALHFIFQQALNKDESDLQNNYWLLQLSEVHEASTQVVKQLTKILRQREQTLPRQALITIAKIIGQSSELRSNQEVYSTSVDAIAEWLQERNADKRMRIAAAQALKSVKLTHLAQQQLVKIAAATSEDVELRVAAIRTLAEAQPEEISSKVAEQLYQVFERRSEPAEVRIHAFRALIQNEQQAEKVLRHLKNESNSQVGYYAGSYLQNVKRSNHHHIESQQVQQQIERFEIPEHLLSAGNKKTARHLNMRQNVAFLDTDLELDADLIYDEQQHLAAVRAKVHMDKQQQQQHQKHDQQQQQGDNVELYIRQRGFDRLVERIADQLDTAIFQKMASQVYELLRNGRSQRVIEQVNKALREFAFDSQMKGSVELTINGKLLISVSSEDLAELTIEPKNNVHQMLQQMTSQAVFNSFLFRRQQLRPTVTGVALETTQQSILLSSVQIGQGKFEPSISYQMQVSAGFSLPYAQPRLTYKVTVNSSPSFRIHTEKDQQGYPTKFTAYMDQQRVTIFRFKSEFQFTNQHEQTKTVEQADRQSKHSFTGLRAATGASFFVETKQSRNAPAAVELHFYIEKEDAEMKGWEIAAQFRAPSYLNPYQLISGNRVYSRSADEPLVYLISFNTPGSRVSREHTIEARFVNTPESKQVKLNLVAQKNHRFTVEAALETKQNKQAVLVQFALNQQKGYLRAAIERKEEGKFVPTVTVELPNGVRRSYTGIVEAKQQQNKKDVLHLQLIDEQEKESATVLNVHLLRSGRFLSRLQDEKFTASVDAQVQLPYYQYKGQQYRYVSHLTVSDNEIEHEQQYSQRRSVNSVPEVYRMSTKISRTGSLLSTRHPLAKYTAHFELTKPRASAQVHFNLNGQILNTNEPRVETELTVFTSQADRKEKQRVLYMQQVLKVQQTSEEQQLNVKLIAQSDKLDVDHELKLQATVARKLKEQPKLNASFTLAKRNQQPTLKAEAAFEMTQAYPLLASAKLITKLPGQSERVYVLHHEVQRQARGKLQSKTKIQWSPKHEILMQHNVQLQHTSGSSYSEPRSYEIDGQIRIPHLNFEWSHQNVLRIARQSLELKSTVRDSKQQVRSEIRAFLSRDQASSIYVDNRLINFKLESSSLKQEDVIMHLHINAKQYNFVHTSRFESKQRQQQIDFTSKTTRDSAILAEARGKATSELATFTAEAGKQKINFNFDRKAGKLTIVGKHDQLLDNHRHQVQASVNFAKRGSVTVDAKVDRDNTLWGKVFAHYDQNAEAEIKVTFGQLQAKISSNQNKLNWTGSVNYAPLSLQQTVRLTIEPQTKTIEAHLKSSSSGKQPITVQVKLSATQESKLTFDDGQSKKLHIEGDLEQQTAKVQYSDSKRQIVHFTNIEVKPRQSRSELIPSIQIRSETKLHQKEYQQIIKISQQQVQIKVGNEQRSFNLQAQQQQSTGAYHVSIEQVNNAGFKRVQRAEGEYLHKKKFSINALQTSADGKQHKLIQLQVQREPQQPKNWNVDVKLGSSIAVELKLKTEPEQKGMIAKLQYPLLKEQHQTNIEVLYSERQDARLVFKHQQDQNTKFDFRANGKINQGKFDVTFTSEQTQFDVQIAEGRAQGSLKNKRNQLNINLNSKWEAQYGRRIQWPKMITIDGQAQQGQKQIAEIKVNQQPQQLSTAKVSLFENELNLTYEPNTQAFKVKAAIPSKAITVDAELNPKQKSVEAQVYSKGTTVVSFQLNTTNAHLQVLEHELSAKLLGSMRSGEERTLDVTYQVQKLKHRTEFFVNYQPQVSKAIVKLISKQNDRSGQTKVYINLDASVQVQSQGFRSKQQIDGSVRLQVVDHFITFDVKQQQHLRISHEYLQHGVKTTTFFVEAVRKDTPSQLWAVQINLLNKHKLEGEIVYTTRYQDNRLQVRYTYVPQQFAARVDLAYKQEQLEYLIAVYKKDQPLYLISANWQRDQKQMNVVFATRHQAKLQLQEKPFNLIATVYTEQKKQLYVQIQKQQTDRLAVELQVDTEQLKAHLNAKTDSASTRFETELDSQFLQLKHRTQLTMDAKKPFDLITKTESRQISFAAEATSLDNETIESKVTYRVHGYNGNFAFEYQPSQQIVIEHECNQPSDSYQLRARVQLDQTPLKGDLVIKRQNEQIKVNMQAEPKKNIDGEPAMRIVVTATKQQQQSGAQKQLFHFETVYTADLMRAKRAGLLDGRLDAQLQFSGKHAEAHYLWKQSGYEFNHELKAKFEQQTYGYSVKTGNSNKQGEMTITLPKNHKIVLQFQQQQKGEWQFIVYPNYTNQPSNKYTVQYRSQYELYTNKLQMHHYVALKHASLRRPITFEQTIKFDASHQTPFEYKVAVDANQQSKQPVFAHIKVESQPEMHQIQFQLQQSETKYLQFAAEWMLDMPRHHQALYWKYDNNYAKQREGGYRFTGNFEQHKYQLELKSINKFQINVQPQSNTEYVLTVVPTEGNVQQAKLYLNLFGESRLQLVDRQSQVHKYVGQATFDRKQGFNLKLKQVGAINKQQPAAEIEIKRDQSEKSFLLLTADVNQQMLSVLKPGAKFEQALSEYSKTHQQMKQIVQSIAKHAFGDHLSELWYLIAKDVYTVLEHALTEKVILSIIHKKPVTPEDYVQAVELIFEFYAKKYEQYIYWFWHDVLPHFWPHHLRNAFNYIVSETVYTVKQQLQQATRQISQFSQQAAKQASKLIKNVDQQYEQFRRQKPAQQLRFIFAQLNDLLADLQKFVDHHVYDLVSMAIEHSHGFTKQWLVRAREAIPRVSNQITRANLAEMFVNVAEILFGQQSSLNGNHLQWKPEGHLEMRFFFPKGVQHYFE